MPVIRTKKQLERAKWLISDLRKKIAELKHTYRHDKEDYDRMTLGMRELLRETEQAVAVYERAQVGNLPAVIGTRDARTGRLEIGRVLQLLRRAAGFGQGELAKLLGTKQANISRWESEGYDRYVLSHLSKIADALGYDLEVSFLSRSGGKHEKGR